MTGLEMSENTEEKNKAKKSGISVSTFLTNFSRDYIEKKPANIKNKLIEELMTQDSLSGTLAEKGLSEFRASDDKYNDIDLDASKIDIYMLRKHVVKGYTLQQKSREQFQTYILEHYDISPNEYDAKISTPVKVLSEKDIERMMGGDLEIQRFLEKHIGKNRVDEKVVFDLLQGVTEKEIQDRLRKIQNPQKTELIVILQKIQKNKIPRDDEIRAIISSSLFDEKQKKSFIHTFLPFISLQQAVDIGLLSETIAQKKLHGYITDTFVGNNLDEENIKKIEQQITLGDISIATRDIVTDNKTAIKVSEGVGFQKYIDNLEFNNEVILEKIRLKGPQSFKEMIVSIEDINHANQYQNLSVFSPGNIIKFTKIDSSGESEVDYVEIVDFDDKKGEFRFKNIGNETINLSSSGEAIPIAYQDFIEGIKNDKNTSFEVISRNIIHEKIKRGDIKSNDLLTLQASDLSGEDNSAIRNRIKTDHIFQLESELTDLQNKYSSTDDIKQKKIIQLDIDSKKNEISNWQQSDITNEEASELYNRQEFLRKLDDIDPEGKELGFGVGVAFITGKKMLEGEYGTYTITSIDYENWKVNFHSESGPENINLDDFYNVFKEKKAKRVKSYINPDDLLSGNDVFKDHSFKNNEIIVKNVEDETGKKGDQIVEYLGSKKGKTIIKIVSISGGFADIQIGERSSADLSSKEKDRGDKKDILKIKGAHTYQWSLDELNRYIKQEDLNPDWKIGKKMTIASKDEQNNFHRSFGNRLMSGFSISDIIHGGKQVIEGITESLNKGSHVKAAHAALAMGKFLPGELSEDLRSKVEAAESEEMDKELKKLGSVDSWIAVKRIKKWLFNKDTPEYKKEAGLLFMLEKYGHLTAKGALAEFRGKFLWYEAFGGRIGDALYNKLKEEAENANPEQTFSEEYLMHNFLKKQCGGHGFNGIHRRSRLHKEFENKWKSGINDEIEKGYKDASNYRDVDKIVREGVGEMKGGTTSNAVGWAKRAGELGGNLEQMNHIPFVLLFSGACYNIDQATYKHIKGFWDGEGQPIVLFRMFGDKAKMKMFDSVMEQLIPDIQKAYPHFSNIEKEAQEVKDGTDEVKRIELANKFWEKYGSAISGALTMSLRSEGTYSATDNILQAKKEVNDTYNTYYEFIRGATQEGNAMKADFIQDWAGPEGAAGINLYTAAKKHMATHSGGGFRDTESAKIIWDGFVDKINAIPGRVIIPGKEVDDAENRKAQKQVIADMLQDVIGAFYEGSQFNEKYISGFNKPTSDTGAALNSWDFNLNRDLGEVSGREISEGKYRRNFERAAEKIISGVDGSVYSTPDVLVKQIKEDTAIINP